VEDVVKAYLLNLGDATSQWFNALFGGDSNHSISGDAYRYGRWGLMFAIDTLFKPWQRDHCKNAYLTDVAKAGALVDEHVRRMARE
jgi:hypothetical protein